MATSRKTSLYPGADHYLKGNLKVEIKNLEIKFKDKSIFIIGGPEILKQVFSLVNEFYLTQIYGNYHCDKFINLLDIKNSMKMEQKIDCDKTCHFEIWKKWNNI